MKEVEYLQAEMRQLKALRRTLDIRIAWIHRRLYSPPINGTNAVNSEPLRKYVQQRIDDHETLGGIAARCGVSERTVTKALRGEPISEASADKLITGLGIPHLYDDIIPPPPESQYYEE